MADHPIKRVAVIGLGPAGAISIDALAQEKSFDVIRVFERREGPGGCWSVYRSISFDSFRIIDTSSGSVTMTARQPSQI